MKDERPLTLHAKFLIKELSITLQCMLKKDFEDEELKKSMEDLANTFLETLPKKQERG